MGPRERVRLSTQGMHYTICRCHLRPSTFDLNTCVARRNTSLADGCRWCRASACCCCCCCCCCACPGSGCGGSCACCGAALLRARPELPVAWWPSAAGIVTLASAAPAAAACTVAVTAAVAPGTPAAGACAGWAPALGSGCDACAAPCPTASGPRLTMPCPGSVVLGRTCTSGWEVRSPAARDSRGKNSSGRICSHNDAASPHLAAQ